MVGKLYTLTYMVGKLHTYVVGKLHTYLVGKLHTYVVWWARCRIANSK